MLSGCTTVAKEILFDIAKNLDFNAVCNINCTEKQVLVAATKHDGCAAVAKGISFLNIAKIEILTLSVTVIVRKNEILVAATKHDGCAAVAKESSFLNIAKIEILTLSVTIVRLNEVLLHCSAAKCYVAVTAVAKEISYLDNAKI